MRMRAPRNDALRWVSAMTVVGAIILPGCEKVGSVSSAVGPCFRVLPQAHAAVGGQGVFVDVARRTGLPRPSGAPTSPAGGPVTPASSNPTPASSNPTPASSNPTPTPASSIPTIAPTPASSTTMPVSNAASTPGPTSPSPTSPSPTSSTVSSSVPGLGRPGRRRRQVPSISGSSHGAGVGTVAPQDPRRDVCLVAYRGAFDPARIRAPLYGSSRSGRYAIVVVGVRSQQVRVVALTDRLPTTLHHH